MKTKYTPLEILARSDAGFVQRSANGDASCVMVPRLGASKWYLNAKQAIHGLTIRSAQPVQIISRSTLNA